MASEDGAAAGSSRPTVAKTMLGLLRRANAGEGAECPAS